MKQKIVVMSAAVCFFVGLETVRAAGFTNIDFYQDATIQAGDSYGNVGVYDTPPGHTTLTITGGTVYNLLSYDASTVNMSDGLVEALGAFEQSTVNMSGGYVSTFHAYDDSAVNMSGGDVYSLKAWEYSIIDFDINAKAFSLGAREHGTVNIKGGITEYLRAGDYGVVNI